MIEYYLGFLKTYNPSGVIFALIVWLILLFISRTNVTYISPLSNNGLSGYKLGFFCFFLVSVLGLHRWDTYHNNDLYTREFDHLEPMHEWLLVNISNENLLIYRLVVFGLSTCILFYIAKRLQLNSRNFLLVCTLFLLDSMYPEMRGTLGHVLLLLGYVLMIDSTNGRKNIFNIVFALCLICTSLFLHRSIFICIIFALISLWDFAKKKIIILSWIIFPLLVIAVDSFFVDIIDFLVVFDYGDMGIEESIAAYTESDFTFGKYNLTGIIVKTISNLSFYLVFIYLTIVFCFKKYSVEPIYRYLFRWYYTCIYVAVLLSCTEVNDWLYHRVNVMALFPMPFILSRIWKYESPGSKWTRAIIISGVIGGLLSFYVRYKDWLGLS